MKDRERFGTFNAQSSAEVMSVRRERDRHRERQIDRQRFGSQRPVNHGGYISAKRETEGGWKVGGENT